MKAIMVMFDSLNKHLLSPYGCDWVITPNFCRLAEKAVTFNNCYVGSMPCMPARRELHTGRYNFLHRSWGPIEPFDDSMPEILKENGIYSHLISDHQHYWEDGGCDYHTRYSSWEISRGQEGDPWKGVVGEINIPDNLAAQKTLLYRQDLVNRKYMNREEDQPQAKTFQTGIEFIQENYNADNWFLQIETFDPHEPFFTQKKYKELYPHEYSGRLFDWPDYKQVDESDNEVKHCIYEYAALISMCDHHLGRILDLMDQHNLWEDTMLIVNTDHGFLLSEHDWWGKCVMPWYNELASIPLFIWDPRSGKANEKRDALVQTIDLPATLLDFFGLVPPPDMQGIALKETIETDCRIREAALFGIFGGQVNCTDGRYVYMRGAQNQDNKPLYQYTLMPTHMRRLFTIQELKTTELVKGFDFTKGCSLLRIDAGVWDERDGYSMSGYCGLKEKNRSYLFDLVKDPNQRSEIIDKDIETKMIKHIKRLMKENDAPIEQYERLGLDTAK